MRDKQLPGWAAGGRARAARSGPALSIAGRANAEETDQPERKGNEKSVGLAGVDHPGNSGTPQSTYSISRIIP